MLSYPKPNDPVSLDIASIELEVDPNHRDRLTEKPTVPHSLQPSALPSIARL